MRLTVPRGYRSKNLEDRRQELQTLDDLLAAKDAARREAEENAAAAELEDRDRQTPPWLKPSTQETLFNPPSGYRSPNLIDRRDEPFWQATMRQALTEIGEGFGANLPPWQQPQRADLDVEQLPDISTPRPEDIEGIGGGMSTAMQKRLQQIQRKARQREGR